MLNYSTTTKYNLYFITNIKNRDVGGRGVGGEQNRKVMMGGYRVIIIT